MVSKYLKETTAPESTPATTTTTPTATSSTSSSLGFGKNIITIGSVNVRYLASVNSEKMGVQPAGSRGLIISDVAVVSGEYVWWKVDFATGVDGWVVANYIAVD